MLTRHFIPVFLLLLAASIQAFAKPNILFFFADDWGRYASIYAEKGTPSLNDVIATPHIDRIGAEGVVFENAFVPVASCGPCRASLATGRYFWNCGTGAFLNRKDSDWKGHNNAFNSLPKFVDVLRDSGNYFVQRSGKTFAFQASKPTAAMKAFGPVEYERYGLYVGAAKTKEERKARHRDIVENSRREIQKILKGPKDQPWFFVYGSINVHRPYVPDSGMKLWGIDPDSLKGRIPRYLPDVEDVRRDFSDYLGEVLALDLKLGVMIEELEKAGELDNTLIMLSGDHGIPGVPRGKTNCYDLGTRVPMLVRWPDKIPAGRRVRDFISVMDVGPTLLEAAGVSDPPKMDGRSFYPQLLSQKSGVVDPERNRVVIGRERHVSHSRPGNIPYPMRAIRTAEFLYIKNFKPERWPMGDPFDAADLANPKALYEMGLSTYPAYKDLDGSLTKAYLMSKRDAEENDRFKLVMEHRPAEELYRLDGDPDHLKNLAKDPELQSVLEGFRNDVEQVMQETKDPRLEDRFDYRPWCAPGLKAVE